MPDAYLPYVELVEELLRPLAEATDDPVLAEQLLRDLGYAPPSEVLAFRELGPMAEALTELAAALRATVAADNQEETLTHLLQFVVTAGAAIKALNGFHTKIQSNFAGSPLLTVTDIVAAIPGKLVDYLIVKFLEDYHPTVFAVLLVGGVVELDDIEEAPTPFHEPYRKRSIAWNNLGALFTDPVGSLKTNFDGGDELLYDRVLYLIQQLGLGLGLLPIHGAPRTNVLQALNRGADLSAIEESEELSTLYFPIIADPTIGVGLDLYPLADPATRKYTGLGLALRASAELEVPLSDAYRLSVKASADVRDGLGVRMERGRDISFISSLFAGPAELAASSQFGLKYSILPTDLGPATKLLSLGAPGGTRLEIGSGSLSFGVEKQAALDLFVEGDLKDGLLSFGVGEADGFIGTLLPTEGITANFNLGVGVSMRAGLYFKGASGLAIRVPLHLELGPLKIDYLGIEVGLDGGRFPLTLTTGISALLGPLAAVVEEIGVRAVFEPKGDRSGSLGPLDVTFAFKPPDGVGLSIDAGVVKGGGYLYFNHDAGEYAGALELTIQDFLSLKAIGLIATRMPDGSKGFSLIIIITAEFSPGIQLGYGFALVGVGGLLGLNRTVVLQALAQGVRTGAVDGLLFPVDVVANAPRILSDMRVIFPPYSGRFLIGPMAKLGWGTPTLISLSLGIIIEIPGNVAILGVLKSILPDEKAEVLKLQVNFVGAIEFDKKRGWFFAALFESRVVFITLEGEMGMLIAVGNDANFVLSVGGFHPRFSPPPLPFPSPRRISLDILRTPVARIRGEAYFAITTNTVQFGARVELFFGFDSFSVEGHMVLDALMRFNPFYFIVEINAGVALKVGGVGCFNISLDFSLEGTTPWRARGRGKIKLLFVTISKSFDETWGDSRQTTLPPIFVIPLLEVEFSRPENWRALPPPSHNLFVSLRKLELNPDELVLHPLGALEVSQNQIPLGMTLERVGAQVPADANSFSLAVTSGGLVRRTDTRRGFAPAQFKKMSDAEKLSSPALENEKSGLELVFDGTELQTGRAVRRTLRYELTTIDTLYRRFVSHFETLDLSAFVHLIKGSAVAKSVLSVNRRKQVRPFNDKIVVGDARYAVVLDDTNGRAAAAPVSFATQGAAQTWLDELAARDPAGAAKLHVIPADEMAAVA